MKKIKIGSLFSGIGGFELGLERAIPNSQTIWQVEQNAYCRSILQKHWPNAKIYNDVRNITKHNVEPIDILCGGFPCQDISVAGKTRGLSGEKSGLWWEMWRIISELRPRIVVMENVANIIRLGGSDVVGSLAAIGYDCEWTIISAKEMGACHLRKRWFAVAYPNGISKSSVSNNAKTLERIPRQLQEFWRENPIESPLCSVDDGIPNRLARLRALGNAIVPQCSQWVGEQIYKSGLLE
tara:strand:+ start:471 stop:1187 length:717 start_codon:yes stop_codon:yes gene_type:complete